MKYVHFLFSVLYFIGFGIALAITGGEVFVLGWGIFMTITGIFWLVSLWWEPDKWRKLVFFILGTAILLIGVFAIMADLSQ